GCEVLGSGPFGARGRGFGLQEAADDQRAGDADDTGDEERESRPAEVDEPARHQAADRSRPSKAEEVEADYAPAQVVGRGELHDRVRVRRPSCKGDTADEEQHAREPYRAERS